MPTMDEVITSQSVRDLAEAAAAGLLVLDSRPNQPQYPSIKQGETDISLALLRWVHAELMASAQRDRNAPNPEFPFKSTRFVGAILAGNGSGDARHYSRVASQVIYLMGRNGLAWKPQQGPRGSGKQSGHWHLWLRHWPPGQTPNLEMGPGLKHADWQTEVAIEREAKVERPVVVRHDLRMIGIPVMEPEAIKDWVGRFVPAALAVQDEAEALRQRVAELEAELEAVVSANGAAGWQAVGESIAEAFDQKEPVKGLKGLATSMAKLMTGEE
jgi:hypothetical protein